MLKPTTVALSSLGLLLLIATSILAGIDIEEQEVVEQLTKKLYSGFQAGGTDISRSLCSPDCYAWLKERRKISGPVLSFSIRRISINPLGGKPNMIFIDVVGTKAKQKDVLIYVGHCKFYDGH